jgi:hypothetical protein
MADLAEMRKEICRQLDLKNKMPMEQQHPRDASALDLPPNPPARVLWQQQHQHHSTGGLQSQHQQQQYHSTGELQPQYQQQQHQHHHREKQKQIPRFSAGKKSIIIRAGSLGRCTAIHHQGPDASEQQPRGQQNRRQHMRVRARSIGSIRLARELARAGASAFARDWMTGSENRFLKFAKNRNSRIYLITI